MLRRDDRARRIVIAATGALLVAFLVIGGLHTPAGQALLGNRCPFGGDEAVAPEEREARRLRANELLRGEGGTTVRRAGDFELGVTTRDEVETWAKTRGGTCAAGQQGQGLRCEGVDADAETILAADFSLDGRLVSLSRMRYSDGADDAARNLSDVAEALRDHVGEPDKTSGEPTAGYLSRGLLTQARSEYRRETYFASLSATHLGPERYLVTEVYRAVD